jgi:hypothetical protein
MLDVLDGLTRHRCSDTCPRRGGHGQGLQPHPPAGCLEARPRRHGQETSSTLASSWQAISNVTWWGIWCNVEVTVGMGTYVITVTV